MAFAMSPRGVYPAEAQVPIIPKSAEPLFVDELWNLPEAQQLIEAAKKSNFVTGITKNVMEPRDFGIYMLQDAAYLASAKVRAT
jgi:hypothetical protein